MQNNKFFENFEFKIVSNHET